MNRLETFFYTQPHRICQKWKHYFSVYDRHFATFVGRPDLRMLEIGVSQGGSLDLWRDYFGAGLKLVGADIDPNCKRFEEPGVDIRIGSQDDPAFLRSLAEEFGPFDIVLDDGGHTMTQQITSFRGLYPAVRDGGVYMVEDCHTSYHEQFGGGIRKPDSFIEFAKGKIDELNGIHVQGYFREFQTEFMRNCTGMAFYDSIVVFERGVVAPIEPVQAGG